MSNNKDFHHDKIYQDHDNIDESMYNYQNMINQDHNIKDENRYDHDMIDH